MRTISSMADRQDIVGSGFFAAVGRAMRRWWQRRFDRRSQRAAIVQLRGMSDRELRDIGISRSQIEFAVTGDFKRERVPSRLELSKAVT